MTPKLVIVDLDGTVVPHSTSRLSPSAAVVEAIAAVRATGVPVAVATGRSLWDGLETSLALGLTDGYVSTTHGAVTYDVHERRVVHTDTMEPAQAIRDFRAADASVAFAVETDEHGWYHTHDFARDFDTRWAGVEELESLAARRVCRLVARLPRHRGQAGARCPQAVALSTRVGLDPRLYCVEPGFKGWIDIGPAGVTKASGCARIAERHGVSAADTVVFGDATNDLPMFAWAGHAVALGQASQEVRDAADEVAPRVEADGVAKVLRRWFR